MKIIITAAIALLLISCSKNPSKFVGVWQTAESGFLTQVTSVVELSKNGTCSFSQSGNWGGNVSFKTKWSVDGKRLVFNIDENPNNYMEILSHSDVSDHPKCTT